MYCGEFKDYQLLDCGDGMKLENWNGYILARPDPVALWPKLDPSLWDKADAVYHRSNKGGGSWQFNKQLPQSWQINFEELTFKVSPTDFKHTGLFPEQAYNWHYLSNLIKENREKDIRVLNLFAYTGAASMVCASAGAKEVVHVDAVKGMINWAKENMALSNLQDKYIRYIVDDCQKFMNREIKRGRQYEIIIMDPPSYGRGPKGEKFQFEDAINDLIVSALNLLSDKALCLIVNSYTTAFSALAMEELLKSQCEKLNKKGKVVSEELAIKVKDKDYYLPCGVSSRYEP